MHDSQILKIHQRQSKVFCIHLTTHQTFELIVGYKNEHQEDEDVYISHFSRKDEIILNWVRDHPLDLMFSKFRDNLYSRVTGFRSEERAFGILKEYLSSNDNKFLKSIRRGDSLEDRKGKDFILSVCFGKRSFTISFDLKCNKQEVEERKSKGLARPTIWMNSKELQSNPELLIAKVLTLAQVLYRKIKNENVHNQELHII